MKSTTVLVEIRDLDALDSAIRTLLDEETSAWFSAREVAALERLRRALRQANRFP